MIRVQIFSWNPNIDQSERREIVMEEVEFDLLQRRVDKINEERAALRARWNAGEDDAEFEPAYQWRVVVERWVDDPPMTAEEAISMYI